MADEGILIEVDEDGKASEDGHDDHKKSRIASSGSDYGTSPRVIEGMRGPSGAVSSRIRPTGKRLSTGDLRQPPMHLGPSNLASKPRQTRYNMVKIKDLAGRASEDSQESHRRNSEGGSSHHVFIPANGNVGSGLLSSAGKDAKDGALAVQTGYGTMNPTGTSHDIVTSNTAVQTGSSEAAHESSEVIVVEVNSSPNPNTPSRPNSSGSRDSQAKRQGSHSSKTVIIGVRSGSITENIVEADGVRKVVLETAGSSEDVEASSSGSGSQPDGGQAGEKRDDDSIEKNQEDEDTKTGNSNKKKRRRKRRKNRDNNNKNAEDTPLLGREN